HVVEIRLGVVTEDAGAVPHRAGLEPRPLVRHDRVALVTKLLRPEQPRDRHDELVARVAPGFTFEGLRASSSPIPRFAPLRSANLDPGVVLAIVAADHARDAVIVVAETCRMHMNEPVDAALGERDDVVLESERDAAPRRAAHARGA